MFHVEHFKERGRKIIYISREIIEKRFLAIIENYKSKQ